VELHWPGPETGEGALFGLMRGFHAWGFRVFHREPNVANVQRCWEFAMAKVSLVFPQARRAYIRAALIIILLLSCF